jgi:hypothetical protein
MSVDEQEQSGCRIGRDYPAPIIDHITAPEEALERYRVPRLAPTSQGLKGPCRSRRATVGF